jgi:hypothetical protein
MTGNGAYAGFAHIGKKIGQCTIELVHGEIFSGSEFKNRGVFVVDSGL